MDKTFDSVDVADYEDVTTAEVTIKDPISGNSTPIVFVVAGPEHPERRRLMMARARRLRNAMQKTGKLQLNDPEDDEAEETETLIVSTLGWRGLVSGGVPLEYSRDAARTLYSDPKRRWLREQVKVALDERERFIKRSALKS